MFDVVSTIHVKAIVRRSFLCGVASIQQYESGVGAYENVQYLKPLKKGLQILSVASLFYSNRGP